MREARGNFEVVAERCPVLENGPEDVHRAAREGDDGLVVAFSFGAFAVVEGAAIRARRAR